MSVTKRVAIAFWRVWHMKAIQTSTSLKYDKVDISNWIYFYIHSDTFTVWNVIRIQYQPCVSFNTTKQTTCRTVVIPTHFLISIAIQSAGLANTMQQNQKTDGAFDDGNHWSVETCFHFWRHYLISKNFVIGWVVISFCCLASMSGSFSVSKAWRQSLDYFAQQVVSKSTYFLLLVALK